MKFALENEEEKLKTLLVDIQVFENSVFRSNQEKGEIMQCSNKFHGINSNLLNEATELRASNKELTDVNSVLKILCLG